MDALLLTKYLRCRDTLIYDKFYGPHEQFCGWNCLICGEIVDPVVLWNRQLMKAGQGIKVLKERMGIQNTSLTGVSWQFILH